MTADPPHLKRRALDDAEDRATTSGSRRPRRPRTICADRRHDRSTRRRGRARRSAASRRPCATNCSLLRQQQRPQPAGPSNFVPSGSDARRIDRRPPSASCATCRSRRSSRARSRADPSARGRSRRPGSCRCCSSRSRTDAGCAALAVLLQRRHVRRRRRRRRAEKVVEQPLAAQHRRRAVRIRRDGQDAALAEQPAAPARRRASRAGSGCRRRSGCRSAAPAAR